MKKVFNKTFAAIMLAIVMVLALFSGLFFAGHGEVAHADGEDVVIKLEADTKSFSKGTKFDLTVKIESTLSTSVFKAISVKIGVLNGDSYDATKCAQLTLGAPTNEIKAGMSAKYPINRSLSLMQFKDTSTFYTANYDSNGLVMLSVADAKGTSTVRCDSGIEFKFSVTIADTVADGTDFTIGILAANVNKFSYKTDGSSDMTIIDTTNSSAFAVQPLTFTVKEPSSVNSLSSIRVGQGQTSADLTPLDTDSTSLSITVKDMNSPISIYPELPPNAGNATIKVKATNDDSDTGTAVNAKEVSKFTIPSDGKLSIIVTAENGDTKEYVLTVKIVDAVLTALTAKSDTKVTGAKEGVQETFSSKTLEYNVFVPSDATKVSITATVSTGNNAKNTVQLSTTGSCTAPASGVSGTAFDVTGIAEGDKLTIKAEAYDGSINSYKNYVITFKIKDVDTAIDLTVVGNKTGKTFTNNATKATDKKVDYYYIVAGETNAASDVTITFPTKATKVTLDSQVYTATKTLTAGEHTVVVTAEAGNTKTYTFILKAYTALQLKSGVTAAFMKEHIDGANVYRKTYKQLNWEHGKDDLDLTRFVIGQIGDYTSVNTFLSNFESSLHNSLKLYKADGELIYDKGAAAGSFTTSDLDDTDKGVGTSWKLEYIVDNDVEETIYLSVLGDIDGDGKAEAADIAALGDVILGVSSAVQSYNENVQVRLASYISNNTAYDNGVIIDATEIPFIGEHIKDIRSLTTYFVT